MATYLGKSCSFGLPQVPLVNCRQFMYLVIFSFRFEGRMWDLIVSVPDHCLSFYFTKDCIKHDLLQTQVLVLQLNFLNYQFRASLQSTIMS